MVVPSTRAEWCATTDFDRRMTATATVGDGDTHDSLTIDHLGRARAGAAAARRGRLRLEARGSYSERFAEGFVWMVVPSSDTRRQISIAT